MIHYPVPPLLSPLYSELACGPGALPTTERLADKVLSMPMGRHLAKEQVDAVIQAAREFAD